jgi:two-component system cell cycle sensor histidine kinase/response regulator CckA
MAAVHRTGNKPGTRYRLTQIAEPLLAWSYRWRWGITHVALGLYVLSFFLLYGRLGVGVASLSTVPVLFAGWLLGARAGFIAGILLFPLNTLLLNLVGHAPGGWDAIIRGSGGPGSLLLVFIGAMTGMLAEELWAHRRAQEALRESEQKFRLISEQSLLAIAILQDDQVKYANQALADIIGYTPEEMMGWPVVEFSRHVHPDDLSTAVEQARKKQQGKVADVTNYCYRLITRDGQLRWIDQYTKTIRYEARPAALVTLIDVTARKQAEEALHLRGAALESAANAIVITDREGFINWVNPAFTRLTGYSEEEVLGRNPRFLRSDHQDEAFYQELWDTILAGKVWHGEMTNRRKDGKEYIEDHTITPVCDEQGNITHFISIRRDITEEKAVQQQLQQQERLAAVGQLAAGIAHDFNNTLAVIVLYSQLLQRNPHLTPKDQERLATIYRQAQQAASLTQQVVDFSRRSLMEPMPMNMLPFLKEMVKLWERTLPESLDLALSDAGGEYVVNADPTRLEQALMNLALNARDAMPDGGRLCLSLSHLSLLAEERPPLVGMEPGHWMCLAVSNNGVGIPPDILPHVFEPFFTT